MYLPKVFAIKLYYQLILLESGNGFCLISRNSERLFYIFFIDIDIYMIHDHPFTTAKMVSFYNSLTKYVSLLVFLDVLVSQMIDSKSKLQNI